MSQAVIRFETEPGLQAQVDWKEFRPADRRWARDKAVCVRDGAGILPEGFRVLHHQHAERSDAGLPSDGLPVFSVGCRARSSMTT